MRKRWRKKRQINIFTPVYRYDISYHFEIISNEVTRKIMDLSIKLKKPIGFGILTCDNLEQALERSNPNKKNNLMIKES